MAALQDRVAIVTGAASGIGRVTALRLMAEGATVVAVDRPEAAMDAAPADAGRYVQSRHDIGDPDAAEAIVAEAVAACGRIDILVNNAGVSGYRALETMTQDWWDRTIAVNLTGTFRLCQQAVPHLRRSAAGRIVNIGSPMAVRTDFGMTAYGASKAGIASLTRSLALELGGYGITANYIEPGAIRTGMTAQAWAERPDLAERRAHQAALGRIGEPEDIAGVIAFLVSADGGFVTGQGIAVDGGLGLRI